MPPCNDCVNKKKSIKNGHNACFLKLSGNITDIDIIDLFYKCIEDENMESFQLLFKYYSYSLNNIVHSLYNKIIKKQYISDTLGRMIHYIRTTRNINVKYWYNLILCRDNVNLLKFMISTFNDKFEYLYILGLRYKSYNCLYHLIEENYLINDRTIFYIIRDGTLDMVKKVKTYTWGKKDLNNCIMFGKLNIFNFLVCNNLKIEIDYNYFIIYFLDIYRSQVIEGYIQPLKMFETVCNRMLKKFSCKDKNNSLINSLYSYVCCPMLTPNRFLVNLYSVLELYSDYIDISESIWRYILTPTKQIKNFILLNQKLLYWFEMKKLVKQELNIITIPELANIISEYI